MGSMSIWHWLILGLVILLLFGKGRFSGMMGDVAKGLKEFKKGMAEDDVPPASGTTNVPPRLDSQPGHTTAQPPQQTPAQTSIDGQPIPPHDPRI